MLIRTAFETDIEFGGAKLNLEKSLGEMKPIVLRSLIIAIPNMISGLLRNDLGTEKLRVILSAISPSGNEPVTIRFLNEGLYLDLRLPEFNRRLGALKDTLGDRQFFSESLLVKMLDGYVRFPLANELEDSEYRRIMASLSADVTGRRGAERDKFIAKQLQGYKRQQIISKLKNG